MEKSKMTDAEMKSQIENTFNYFVKRQKSVTFWIDENAVVFEFDGKEKRKEFECRELAEWFIATLIALFEKEVESGVLQFKNSVKKFVIFPGKQKENAAGAMTVKTVKIKLNNRMEKQW